MIKLRFMKQLICYLLYGILRILWICLNCATLFPFFQAIWNWVENSPDEFARLQRQPSSELSGNIIGVIEWLGIPGRNIFGLQVAKYRQSNLIWPNYVKIFSSCASLKSFQSMQKNSLIWWITLQRVPKGKPQYGHFK